MKVTNLTHGSKIYTSNVYLGTGTWNTMSDVNTLIDVGRDTMIFEKIFDYSTGVGKHKVEQIILTHSHYDHAEILSSVKKEFHAKVLAFSKSLDGVDHYLKGGEIIQIGDLSFEVIHAPGHSSDSICLYNREEKILFSGDNPLVINTDEGEYDEAYIEVMRRLSKLPVEKIYPGHGRPIIGRCNEFIKTTLKHMSHISA